MLQTERCILNDLQQSDFQDVKKLYVNEDVRKFLGGVVDPDKLVAARGEMLSEKGSYYWVVREKKTGSFIGLVSITDHHDGKYKEVSYQLMPDWWGTGYGSEVVSGIILFALEELKLPGLIAETQTANKASCRLLEKVGMEKKETLIRFGSEQAIYCLMKEKV